MSQVDEYEMIESAKGAPMPILGFLAYPEHIAFVPERLFYINVFFSLGAGLFVGTGITDEFFSPWVSIPLAVVIHCIFAISYWRDRFFEGVVMAKYFTGSPFPPIFGKAGVIPRRRKVTRFI